MSIESHRTRINVSPLNVYDADFANARVCNFDYYIFQGVDKQHLNIALVIIFSCRYERKIVK